MKTGSLANVAVEDNERLAHFVLHKRWIPKGDTGVKAQALLPYKWVELSVSRHRGITEAELWELGRSVALERAANEGRDLSLIGRIDLLALTARKQNLEVVPAEPPINHANIIDWPAEKPAQMSLAQEIAAESKFIQSL